MFRLTVYLPFISAICLTVAGCEANAPKSGETIVESKAIVLDLVDYAGVQKVIASHRGKIVVLDAWSTSCDPCLREFPHLVELSKTHSETVACVSLSVDFEGIGRPEDQREKVLEFLQQQHATIDNLLATEDSDAMLKHLGVASIPAVFIFDREGKRAETIDQAEFTYRDVEAKIQALLAK